MPELADLIEHTYGIVDRRAFETLVMTDSDFVALRAIGQEVLSNFPYAPGACGAMCAMFLTCWERNPTPKMFMVAGEFYINQSRVWGYDGMSGAIQDDLKTSDLSWNGHYWLALGEYIIDLSVFRTAYSDGSPPLLREHILNEFGENRGMLVSNSSGLIEKGLRYVPHAVLTYDQVTSIALGAKMYFK